MLKSKTYLFLLCLCLVCLLSCRLTDKQKDHNCPVELPVGAASLTYDIGNNYWCLVPGKNKNESVLMVLPADSVRWEVESLSGLKPGDWQAIFADEYGYLWLAGESKIMSLSLTKPQEGWKDCSNNPKLVDGRMVLLKEGKITIPAKGKWKENWEVVSRLPGSNHDLRGDILNNKFYMSGGLTAQYGYPLQSHAYSNVFEFDGKTETWRIFADLGRERIYCATGVLGNKLLVCGGDIFDNSGTRYTTNLTQVIDLDKRLVEAGIPLDFKSPSPLAFHLNNRLYVLGFLSENYNQEHELKIQSIGEGENSWNDEPDGPKGKGAIYGCSFDGKIYVVMANKYVGAYDVQNRKWSTIEMMVKVRSPQVTHYQGELWVLGGRIQEDQASVQIYNFEKEQWRKGPDLPRELAWGVAFNINDEMYVAGGAAGRAYNNRTFRLKK